MTVESTTFEIICVLTFINSYKLTKIIKWKKVINTEVTSGHFGRKKKRTRSQSTSVNYYIRFLKTDKVRLVSLK